MQCARVRLLSQTQRRFTLALSIVPPSRALAVQDLSDHGERAAVPLPAAVWRRRSTARIGAVEEVCWSPRLVCAYGQGGGEDNIRRGGSSQVLWSVLAIREGQSSGQHRGFEGRAPNSIFGRSRRDRDRFPRGSGGKRDGGSHLSGPHWPLWQPVHTCSYWSVAHVACEKSSQWPAGVRMICGFVCAEPIAMSEKEYGPVGRCATAWTCPQRYCWHTCKNATQIPSNIVVHTTSELRSHDPTEHGPGMRSEGAALPFRPFDIACPQRDRWHSGLGRMQPRCQR